MTPQRSIAAAVMVEMDVTALPPEAMPQLVAALRDELRSVVARAFNTETETVTLLLPSDVETWTAPPKPPGYGQWQNTDDAGRRGD